MSIQKKLLGFIENKKAQMQRGIKITNQMKAERQRQKILDARYGPGTIRYGLMNNQNPLDFMHDIYDKRKMDREQKANKK